jgi:ornithine carbamoyltransferase
VEVIHDAKVAAAGASILYTDVWMSMGDPESERGEKVAALSPFQVNDSLFALAAQDSIFMHCLPAHRGEEVSASVIDGERSLIWRQAFHRRTTIQALLFHLTRGELSGNPAGF